MADKIQIIFKEIVEVAGSGSGAAIDDTVVSTTKTWSSQKISDELSTKANSSHTHTSAEITDFNTQVDDKITTHNTDTTAHSDIRTALNNKAEIDDTTVSTTKTYSSQKIEDSLSTKADANHTHTKADITDFSHTHNISDVNNLQSELDSKVNKPTTFVADNLASIDTNGNIKDSGKSPLDFAPTSHTHTKADITDFSHTHSIADITNLQTELDSKALLDLSNVADNTILIKLKNVDGAGSGLDADTLDGLDSSAFASATHTHGLNDLSDVDVSTVSDGQVLSYDSTSGLWIPATVSGGGGSGNYKQVADIILSTTATEVIISGLNNNLIDIFVALSNTSGSHTYLYIYVSYDNGTTWLGFDYYGILITSTGAVDKWNGSWGYLKNNSTLWSKLEIKRFPNTNSVYINAPTRSNSNNRWRNAQAFATGVTGNITDVKITTDGTATFDAGSQITVFTGD